MILSPMLLSLLNIAQRQPRPPVVNIVTCFSKIMIFPSLEFQVLANQLVQFMQRTAGISGPSSMSIFISSSFSLIYVFQFHLELKIQREIFCNLPRILVIIVLLKLVLQWLRRYSADLLTQLIKLLKDHHWILCKVYICIIQSLLYNHTPNEYAT